MVSTSNRPDGSGPSSTGGDGEGATVVFTSSDLDELVAQSDRIAVFFAGEVVGVVDTSTATISELGHLIGGLAPA